MRKERCLISLCPWKAKYDFTSIDGELSDYKECWFHYMEMPLLNWLWDLFGYLPHLFYDWIKYRVCLGVKGLRWKISLKFWLLPWYYIKSDIF